MVSNIVTLDKLDDLFADFIQDKLELPADKVLISYSRKGQISSKYGENVCYLKFLATLLNEVFYTDGAKQFLYKNNLALIPDRTNYPNKTIENINEQWWNRSDLKLYFYNSISIEETTGTIEDYNVIIKTDRMEETT